MSNNFKAESRPSSTMTSDNRGYRNLRILHRFCGSPQVKVTVSGFHNNHKIESAIMLLRQASFAFLLGSILCAQSTPAAVEIRVRALDYRTGHPLKDHRIAMWLSDSAGHIQYHKSEKLIQTTGKNGYAVFRIKEPLPPSVMIDTDSLPDLNCSATSELATGAVLQDGIVGQEKSDAKCTRKRPPPATSAVPGEVVIYVHQLGLFDRLHRLFY